MPSKGGVQRIISQTSLSLNCILEKEMVQLLQEMQSLLFLRLRSKKPKCAISWPEVPRSMHSQCLLGLKQPPWCDILVNFFQTSIWTFCQRQSLRSFCHQPWTCIFLHVDLAAIFPIRAGTIQSPNVNPRFCWCLIHGQYWASEHHISIHMWYRILPQMSLDSWPVGWSWNS